MRCTLDFDRAIAAGDLSALQRGLAEGFLKCADQADGALLKAVRANQIGFVRALLDGGIADPCGDVLLDIARHICTNNQADMVEVLVNAGVTFPIDAIVWAAESASKEVIRTLIDLGQPLRRIDPGAVNDSDLFRVLFGLDMLKLGPTETLELTNKEGTPFRHVAWACVRLANAQSRNYLGIPPAAKSVLEDFDRLVEPGSEDWRVAKAYKLKQPVDGNLQILSEALTGAALVDDLPIEILLRRQMGRQWAETLLAAGIPTGYRDHSGRTLTDIATSLADASMAKVFNDHGIPFSGCGHGRVPVFKLPMMENLKIDVRRSRPLICDFRDPSHALRLLDKHPELATEVTAGDRVPLMYSEALGTAVTQALLDAGADITAKDRQGRTPLHYAAAIPSWGTWEKECVEIL